MYLLAYADPSADTCKLMYRYMHMKRLPKQIDPDNQIERWGYPRSEQHRQGGLRVENWVPEHGVSGNKLIYPIRYIPIRVRFMKVRVSVYISMCPKCGKIVKGFTEKQCRSVLASHIRGVHREEPPENPVIKTVESEVDI